MNLEVAVVLAGWLVVGLAVISVHKDKSKSLHRDQPNEKQAVKKRRSARKESDRSSDAELYAESFCFALECILTFLSSD